jgi:hypothetical protein
LCVPALAVAALAFVAIPTAAEAQAAPKPAATQAAAPGSPKPAPHLPINLSVGPIQVKVDLPLTVPGLLGLGRSTSAPPPTTSAPAPKPPTTTARPPTTAPNKPAPHSTPTHRATRTRVVVISALPADNPAAAATTKSRQHRHASTAPPKHSRRPPPSTLVSRAFQPGSPALILITLVCVCALGVAAVVVLGGHRGRRAN